VISTRRFCARPSAVAFEAAGSRSLRQSAVILSLCTPLAARECVTDAARRCDNLMLYASEPALSA